MLVTILKRFLDVLIVVYIILIPIVIFTGGFKIEVLGITIRASHLYTPLRFLIPLILIRLLITVEFKNFLLILGSIFMALIGAEVILRAWAPAITQPQAAQIFQPSPTLGWELIPRSSGTGALGEIYEINSHGQRDFEYPLKRREGLYRIVVIGDSFTFGAAVNLADTYPKQLERLLNERGGTYDVINFGVSGHDMWQHFKMLKTRALRYRPDLVILTLYQNDLITIERQLADDYQGETPPLPEDPSQMFMRRFALWNFLKHVNDQFEYRYRARRGHFYLKSIEERRKVLGSGHPTDLNYRIMAGKAEPERYAAFSIKLKEFVETAGASGAIVLVALIPDAVQLHDRDMQGLNRFLAQASTEVGVPFVDTTPALEAAGDPRNLYLFPFDAHNSPRGLEVIATTIADKVSELNLGIRTDTDKVSWQN